MSQTAELLHKIRTMQFEKLYKQWRAKRISQREGAELLGISERTFRRYVVRYEVEGAEGLRDGRIGRDSPRKALETEVRALEELYRGRYKGRNVKHFYEAYVEDHGGERSYSWVKSRLHCSGLAKGYRRRGPYRQSRDRKKKRGTMLHQDGSQHSWVKNRKWFLIVTMDDATGEIYSGFFVDQEGMWSSMRGVREVLERKGLFVSLYTDRGSHYWTTCKAGGKVDKNKPTEFGRAMAELGITMIAGYSPQARGRCERVFRTLQGRLPRELEEAGITEMEEANEFMEKKFLSAHNRKFMTEPMEEGSDFVELLGAQLDDILCVKRERVVGNDNCVSYKGRRLQIPPVDDRNHFVRARVMVHEHSDGRMSVHHERQRLGIYDREGKLINHKQEEKSGRTRRRRFTSASSGYALGG